MRRHAMAVAASVVPVLLLSACAENAGSHRIDMTPVGEGLEFIGLAGVLAALIIVIGLWLNRADPLLQWARSVMLGLFALLAVIVATAALPWLILPILVAVAVLVAWLLLGGRL